MNNPTNHTLEPVVLRHDLDRLRRETVWTVNTTDEQTSTLLYQIVDLEEMLFARWPRSVLARRRWRRDVRESIRRVQGDDFREKRIEALGTDWLTRAGSRWNPWAWRSGR